MKTALISILVLLVAQSCMSQMLGVYYWTWSTGNVNVSDSNMGVAFSGYVNPEQAISDSARVAEKLKGEKWLDIGGGDSSGHWTSNWVQQVGSYCTNGKFSGYSGICFDIEEGDSGLAGDFSKTFQACKSAGFKVFITTSASAPYGVGDAATLMRSFFPNPNIDFLSPQIYCGDPNKNCYTVNSGVTFNEYASAKAKIVPSIWHAGNYNDAYNVFKNQFGITLAGYVRWAQDS